MSQSYVIEIDEESVGLVVRKDGDRSFVFHAASSRFGVLDGQAFASVRAAERAAANLHRRPAVAASQRPAGLRQAAVGGR
ncbi:MAG: hypothetical protein WD341_20660 [Tistlia sp.]|uniref:hypothetical protein n=1 Tax=Tistlia sp. TaxID=3057121 RepID=UPI0034A10270